MADEVRQLTLDEAAAHLLEECRMVLPGIQALFGFQLVVVFSNGFSSALSGTEQSLHLGATLCTVLAIALVMSPAAMHRMCEPDSVSQRFIRISSRLLMLGMAPLGVATTLDVYLVARVILHSRPLAIAAGAGTLVVFAGLWVALPAFARVGRATRAAP